MRRLVPAAAVLVLAILTGTGCASQADDDSTSSPPPPAPSATEALEVPSEPAHVPYVPSDFIPVGSGPGVWSGDQAPAVLAASIDGIGYPMPPGGAYEEYDFDPSTGYEIGTLESIVAFEWNCAWLREWDAAADAGDEQLVAKIEVLLDVFWTLPHIRLLEDDGMSFRDQQVRDAPAGADLNVWMLRNFC